MRCLASERERPARARDRIPRYSGRGEGANASETEEQRAMERAGRRLCENGRRERWRDKDKDGRRLGGMCGAERIANTHSAVVRKPSPRKPPSCAYSVQTTAACTTTIHTFISLLPGCAFAPLHPRLLNLYQSPTHLASPLPSLLPPLCSPARTSPLTPRLVLIRKVHLPAHIALPHLLAVLALDPASPHAQFCVSPLSTSRTGRREKGGGGTHLASCRGGCIRTSCPKLLRGLEGLGGRVRMGELGDGASVSGADKYSEWEGERAMCCASQVRETSRELLLCVRFLGTEKWVFGYGKTTWDPKSGAGERCWFDQTALWRN